MSIILLSNDTSHLMGNIYVGSYSLMIKFYAIALVGDQYFLLPEPTDQSTGRSQITLNNGSIMQSSGENTFNNVVSAINFSLYTPTSPVNTDIYIVFAQVINERCYSNISLQKIIPINITGRVYRYSGKKYSLVFTSGDCLHMFDEPSPAVSIRTGFIQFHYYSGPRPMGSINAYNFDSLVAPALPSNGTIAAPAAQMLAYEQLKLRCDGLYISPATTTSSPALTLVSSDAAGCVFSFPMTLTIESRLVRLDLSTNFETAMFTVWCV